MGRHRRDREGGAIQRELPRTRDQSIDLRGSSRIALEDGLSLACRDGHRIERREALGGRYRVQALEAGAQGAQALGGLQPRWSPHPALDVVHEDPAAVECGVEHGRRHARCSRSAVAGHLAQRVSPRPRPLPDPLP